MGRKSRFAPLLEDMRAFVRRVLGMEPCLERIYNDCMFGSGAAIGVHGNATHLHAKLYASEYTVTRHAAPHALKALWRNPQLAISILNNGEGIACLDEADFLAKVKSKLKFVDGNKLHYVPKNAKSHRAIRIEPLLNNFIQTGVDAEMRRLLSRFGYDLTDQGKNSALARVGSRDGSFATLDLSSASDTVSYQVVKALLPTAWFRLLDDLRSPGELGGEHYQMFASMGNGFCFPLETLIFAAACRACMRVSGVEDKAHAVYGDDIIIPTQCASLLIALLGFLGFVPNKDKSFVDGPFRESCGADWYLGQDVRPVYLDYPLTSETSVRIFHNATYRGERQATAFREVREYLRQLYPKAYVRPFTGYRCAERTDEPIVLANLNGAFDVPLDVFMASRNAIWSRAWQAWTWKEKLYLPIADDCTGCTADRARYLAFLRGSPGGELAYRRMTRCITHITT